MPQTVEHFQICRLLEIPTGIIAITKKDQVDRELLGIVSDEVKDLVKNSFLETAPICMVDSLSGEGISELKEVLRQGIEELDRAGRVSPSVDRIFRLPIDRVFTVKGFGTVVTGTPQGGEIHQEEAIAVYPGGQTGKIRGIQIFGEKTEIARAGQRTALNLSGIDKEALERGMVLGAPKLLNTSQRFDAKIELLETAPSALCNRDPIRFHHGSGEMLGRVYLMGNRQLEPGQEVVAQIRLDDQSIVCFPGDRFVLRRYSPLTTIGGGIILDSNPRRWRKREFEENLSRLREIQSALTDEGGPRFETLIQYFVERSGVHGLQLNSLCALVGLNSSKVQEILNSLENILMVPAEPPIFVAESNISRLKERIRLYLEKHHQNRPLSSGASREELKERFLPGGSSPYFQFLLSSWQQDNFIEIRGSSVALCGSRITLTPEQEDTRSRILKIIESSKLKTPTPDEIVKKLGGGKVEIREILFYLLERGEIVRIAGDMLLLPSQLESLERRVRDRFPSGTPFSVSDFKQLLSVSRKFAIPLLEYLDRKKVTRRTGDNRVVI
jgi:selenocysteine-specific elongation factor